MPPPTKEYSCDRQMPHSVEFVIIGSKIELHAVHATARLSGGMKKLTRSYLSDAHGLTKTVLKCVN